MEIKKQYYTPAEFAKLVGAHHLTILRIIRKGELNATNIGGSYVIDASDAKKWIKAHTNDTDGRRLKIGRGEK